ncbi:MAG: hypothetical protein M1514_00285 [Patescibacteria group bacterium]|nr:hypothetical protein [Patescibacteria group bacterium]
MWQESQTHPREIGEWLLRTTFPLAFVPIEEEKIIRALEINLLPLLGGEKGFAFKINKVLENALSEADRRTSRGFWERFKPFATTALSLVDANFLKNISEEIPWGLKLDFTERIEEISRSLQTNLLKTVVNQSNLKQTSEEVFRAILLVFSKTLLKQPEKLVERVKRLSVHEWASSNDSPRKTMVVRVDSQDLLDTPWTKDFIEQHLK